LSKDTVERMLWTICCTRLI